jgi:SAM-dependent methyltransferase
MKPIAPERWKDLGEDPDATWYLDPVVAAQKGALTRALVQRWTAGAEVARYLKTDVFEEAHGEDALIGRLHDGRPEAIGVDVAWGTVRAAAERCGARAAWFFATDLRNIALPPECVDLVVSTSTLDHFADLDDVRRALAELARVLRPGGRMIITLDNPQNLLYPALRWASRRPRAPFPLGLTFRREALNDELARAGLEVEANDWLIHNPRMLSTALVLSLRRLLGARADAPIRGLLALFALLGRLPTRRYSACFVAACARKSGRPTASATDRRDAPRVTRPVRPLLDSGHRPPGELPPEP